MREAETGGFAADTFGGLLGGLIRERREVGGFTQLELAEESFPDLSDHDGKERRIRELEAGQVANPRATNYTPICETLGIDRSLIRALKTRAKNARQQEATEFQELIELRGSASQALADIPTLSRDELELLASRFEIPNPHRLSDFELCDLLSLKAEDYRQLKAKVETIKGLTDRIDNIYGAATEAIERLEFDQANDLILSARDIHQDTVLRPALETNAKLLQKQAEIALLRGRVDEAHALLSTAADSFLSLDPLEPARRRFDYMKLLYLNSLRYGGTDLRYGIQMLSHPSIAQLRHPEAELWGKVQNNRAIALQELGALTGGDKGANLLSQAVDAFRAALEVRSRQSHPLQRATTQINLGNALQVQGTRATGEASKDLLQDAIAAYRDALTLVTRQDQSVLWATAQNNLGIVLQLLASRCDDDTTGPLLDQSIAAFHSALMVRTKTDLPVPWATTLNNLGATLHVQGTHAGGNQGTVHLADAVAAFRDALTIYTRNDYPVDWAMTQNNLASALDEQGSRTPGQAGAGLLTDAKHAFHGALTVYTRDTNPVNWAATCENLARCETSCADHDTATDPKAHLITAFDLVDKALTVYDPTHMPHEYAKATALRDRIMARLPG